jgi:N-acetyl-anhydromuramyl-L-alanine amidase AmpD
MVNDNTGHMPYSEAQVAACAEICRYLMDEYDVQAEDVVRHADVAPGRKNDPLGFDMDGFRKRIKEAM